MKYLGLGGALLAAVLLAACERPKEEEAGKVIRQERRYGKFLRSFNLGSDVQESDIKASFKDGVLTLQAPKLVEKEVERRRIEID